MEPSSPVFAGFSNETTQKKTVKTKERRNGERCWLTTQQRGGIIVVVVVLIWVLEVKEKKRKRNRKREYIFCSSRPRESADGDKLQTRIYLAGSLADVS